VENVILFNNLLFFPWIKHSDSYECSPVFAEVQRFLLLNRCFVSRLDLFIVNRNCTRLLQ